MVKSTVPVFISFDYDHDDDLRVILLGQAKHKGAPFSFEDWSIKQETRGWRDDARKRIKRSNVRKHRDDVYRQVATLVGENMVIPLVRRPDSGG